MVFFNVSYLRFPQRFLTSFPPPFSLQPLSRFIPELLIPFLSHTATTHDFSVTY
jgi:hypothetical protein